MKFTTMKIQSVIVYRRWLSEQFDNIRSIIESDYYIEIDIADIVEQASILACRFGAGHLIDSEKPIIKPREALIVIGRLLNWASKPVASDLLSVNQVADLMGISSRTVWRMVSANEISAPIKVGSRTKWRREEVQAIIDLIPSIQR